MKYKVDSNGSDVVFGKTIVLIRIRKRRSYSKSNQERGFAYTSVANENELEKVVAKN